MNLESLLTAVRIVRAHSSAVDRNDKLDGLIWNIAGALAIAKTPSNGAEKLGFGDWINAVPVVKWVPQARLKDYPNLRTLSDYGRGGNFQAG